MTYKPNAQAFLDLASLWTQHTRAIAPARLRNLLYSTGLDHYHIFLSPVEAISGYISWAFVCDETIIRLDQHSIFPSYVYEWSEGTIALILDVQFRQSGHRLTRSVIAQALSRDIDRVAYVRRHGLRLYRNVAGQMQRVQLDDFVRLGTGDHLPDA